MPKVNARVSRKFINYYPSNDAILVSGKTLSGGCEFILQRYFARTKHRTVESGRYTGFVVISIVSELETEANHATMRESFLCSKPTFH